MTIKFDPQFKREVDQLRADIKIEDFLSDVSEEFEAIQLYESAKLKGKEFSDGFLEGFTAGQELRTKYDTARAQSIHQKQNALSQRWGLHKL